MPSFFHSTVGDFLDLDMEYVLARLSLGYATRGYTSQYADQTLTWERDLRRLKECLAHCVARSAGALSWGLLLEFSIPRKELRIDAIVLIGEVIVILEAKTGPAATEAKRQLEEYALLLHYFHKRSNQRRVIPVGVSPDAAQPDLTKLRQGEFFPQLPTYWIAPVIFSSWKYLLELFIEIRGYSAHQASVEEFDTSPYFPVPSIIEAATALRSGLSIREIAHSEASEHEIETVRNTIQHFVDRACADRQHTICFLTGVPGSGKTLVGLGLAHSQENKGSPIHFMSGNGPLVKVLQHLFTQESMRSGASAPQARTEARTLIENVHVFARYHTEDDARAPANHAIIFDEAQRAWNRSQNLKKFKRNYSEPEMLLRIMERHSDWAVIIALVGGGQEINDGEAGLEEWGRALTSTAKSWRIHASPEVIGGGVSTAGHRLFDVAAESQMVRSSSELHLRTSNRSLRADQLATWVNCVIEGDSDGAASLNIPDKFPILLTRSLDETRRKLREQGLGDNRYGLVGSSGAARLRAIGLEPSSSFHAEYPWEHWYLAEETDVRSSFRCEVFATEFEIQGLELDWVGLCWGGDFVWGISKGWQMRALRQGRQSKWTSIKSREKQIFRRNAYRVLLTRARKGMVIYVPAGDTSDPTNRPDEFEETAQYLSRCGVIPLSRP